MSPELSPSPAASPEPEPASAAAPMTHSEECYFCGGRVYALERISAEGKFFHRSCFTCHRCGITLRLGGYTFDQTTGEEAPWEWSPKDVSNMLTWINLTVAVEG